MPWNFADCFFFFSTKGSLKMIPGKTLNKPFFGGVRWGSRFGAGCSWPQKTCRLPTFMAETRGVIVPIDSNQLPLRNVWILRNLYVTRGFAAEKTFLGQAQE